MLLALIEFLQELFKSLAIIVKNWAKSVTTPQVKVDETTSTVDTTAADGTDLLSDPDNIGVTVFPEELDMQTIDKITPPVLPEIVITDTPTINDTEEEEEEEEQKEEDTPLTPSHQARYIWCLDNGHGKLTAGKRSPKFKDGSRFLEYQFNRDIVKRITIQLQKNGVQYYNVVPEVNTDNFLKERVARANTHQSDLPKLLVSIHANAAPSKSINHWATPGAKGIETWYYTGSRRGQKLARIFQKHIVNYTGMVNRGLKSTKKLYVIKNSTMTACLTENGFYNHKTEVKALLKSEVRQSIADAHVAAIMEIEKYGL